MEKQYKQLGGGNDVKYVACHSLNKGDVIEGVFLRQFTNSKNDKLIDVQLRLTEELKGYTHKKHKNGKVIGEEQYDLNVGDVITFNGVAQLSGLIRAMGGLTDGTEYRFTYEGKNPDFNDAHQVRAEEVSTGEDASTSDTTEIADVGI